MIVQGQKVLLQRWQIMEILERWKSKLKEDFRIDDVFMVMPSPNEFEWDTLVETDFGPLRTFCVDPRKLSSSEGIPGAKILFLHKHKYKYPEISPFKDKIAN